jgi:hypothetical protein
MTWSLLNHMVADKVSELLDGQRDAYPPEVTRFFPREKAAGIIHAALWGYAVRDDSTAGCYAFSALMDTLGIKSWVFDEDEAAVLRDYRIKKAQAIRAALTDGQKLNSEPT